MIYDNFACSDSRHDVTIKIETEDQESMQKVMTAVAEAMRSIDEVEDCWVSELRCMNEEGEMEEFNRMDSPFDF